MVNSTLDTTTGTDATNTNTSANTLTDATTSGSSTDGTTEAVAKNDPVKNKKLATVTMMEPLRSLLDFTVTLPGTFKGLHTNQFCWLSVRDDFYDSFYKDIAKTIGDTKFSRYTGFKEGRFYIEGVRTRFDLNDGITTELTLNPFASMYSEYIKMQLNAEQALQEALQPKSSGSSATTATGGGLGSNVQEICTNLENKYTYKLGGGCSSYSCMKKGGFGDCWAWAGALWRECTNIGMKMKVVQYRSCGGIQNHRSCLYLNESNQWASFPYKQYFKKKAILWGIADWPTSKGGDLHGTVMVDENGNGSASATT